MKTKEYKMIISPNSGSGLNRSIKVIGNNFENCVKIAEMVQEGKMVDYTELPDINTDDFKTIYDNLPCNNARGYAESQYQKGFNLIKDYDYVYLRYSWGQPFGTWGATAYHKSLTAYETIGLHANTKELFEGMIESGIVIVDFRS